METKILRYNNEGEGVAVVNDITTFIPYVLKNEKVNVEINESFDNYQRGTLLETIDKSKNRIEPLCPKFYICGGCNLMHMNKEEQLEFKKEKIESIFKKISCISI